jgi:hypothetical protein
VPRAGAKEMAMAVEEHLERHGDSLHQRSGQPSSKAYGYLTNRKLQFALQVTNQL